MQNEVWQWIVALLVSYLMGSIPVGILVVRWARGIDVRRVGSGRTGGTNVLRAAGWKAAVFTGLGDASKATLAVLVARWLHGPSLLLALAGAAAVVGHNYSLFLGFRGGAGTGASIGVGTGPVARERADHGTRANGRERGHRQGFPGIDNDHIGATSCVCRAGYPRPWALGLRRSRAGDFCGHSLGPAAQHQAATGWQRAPGSAGKECVEGELRGLRVTQTGRFSPILFYE